MTQVSAQALIESVWILAGLSLVFLLTRCFVRLFKIRLPLNVSDYLVIVSWIAALIVAILYTQVYVTHGFEVQEDPHSPNVNVSADEAITQLKILYASLFFSQTGLYLPKFSFLAYYYKWISVGYPRLRIALYCITVFVGAGYLIALLSGWLWCRPMAQNWSLDFTQCHTFFENSFIETLWVINILADIFIFTLPFFLLPSLKLQKRTFYAAMLVFLLGAVTIAASIVRIVGFYVFPNPNPIYLVFSLELNLSIIVTCLPSLKIFVATGAPDGTISSWYRKLSGRNLESTAQKSFSLPADSRAGSFGPAGVDLESHDGLMIHEREEDSAQGK